MSAYLSDPMIRDAYDLRIAEYYSARDEYDTLTTQLHLAGKAVEVELVSERLDDEDATRDGLATDQNAEYWRSCIRSAWARAELRAADAGHALRDLLT